MKEPIFIVLNNPFGASLDLNPKSAAAIVHLAEAADAEAPDKVTKDKAKAMDRVALAKLFTSCIPAITSLQDDLEDIANQVDDPEKAEITAFGQQLSDIGSKLLDFCKAKSLAPKSATLPAVAPTAPPIAADTSAGNLGYLNPNAAPTAGKP
jgi:hypothetical protein